MEHQKLTELYHSYEYFLSTSYFEGNPKSILEALNSGVLFLQAIFLVTES
jgi:glycosyltransferase involved in cell wall biosynthesis